MQKYLTISIIILNWNTKKNLENCIRSIYQYINIDDYEIIVVDNGSTDNSVQMLKSNFPKVKLVENNKNLGFSKANNIGAKYADGKYLLFLNSDTLFINETDIGYLVSKIETNKKIGIIACQLLNKDGSVQQSISRFPTPLNIFFYQTRLSKIFNKNIFFNKRLIPCGYNSEQFVDQPSGAFLMIRKKLFFKIGGFDEKFFIYYDDVDLCKQTILTGKKILFTPKSKIIHIGSESVKLVKGVYSFENHKNLILYYKKYHTPKKVTIMKVALFLGLLFRNINWLIRSMFRKKYLYILKENIYFMFKIWSI